MASRHCFDIGVILAEHADRAQKTKFYVRCVMDWNSPSFSVNNSPPVFCFPFPSFWAKRTGDGGGEREREHFVQNWILSKTVKTTKWIKADSVKKIGKLVTLKTRNLNSKEREGKRKTREKKRKTRRRRRRKEEGGKKERERKKAVNERKLEKPSKAHLIMYFSSDGKAIKKTY